jgi:hypothetical protein
MRRALPSLGLVIAAGCGGPERRVGYTKPEAERYVRRTIDALHRRAQADCTRVRVTRVECRAHGRGWRCRVDETSPDRATVDTMDLTGHAHPEITTIC